MVKREQKKTVSHIQRTNFQLKKQALLASANGNVWQFRMWIGDRKVLI